MVPRLDRLARNLPEGLRTIEELHAQGIHIRSLAEGLDTGDGSPTAAPPWWPNMSPPTSPAETPVCSAPPAGVISVLRQVRIKRNMPA